MTSTNNSMQQKEDIAASCCWSFHEEPQWYLRMCICMTYLAALLGAKLLSTIALTDIFYKQGTRLMHLLASPVQMTDLVRQSRRQKPQKCICVL